MKYNSKISIKTFAVIIVAIIIAIVFCSLIYIRREDIKSVDEEIRKMDNERADSDIEENKNDIKDTGIFNYSMFVEYSYTTDLHLEDNPVKNNIGLYEKDGNNYFFLPKNIDLSNLIINYTEDIESVENASLDKETKIIKGSFQNDTSFKVKYSNGVEKEINILQSDLPAICINNITVVDKSGNVLEEKTLSDVKKDGKDKKYDIDILIENGNNYLEDLKYSNVEFKGRGNYTWTLSKRGFQIKLDNKVDVFSMGEAKKWVLIPNYTDNSLMRNKLILDMAKDINMDYTSNSTWVDLWIDGEFQGNYLLTEKVEVGKNRVDLKNDDGILVELDNIYFQDEDLWFKSKVSKSYFVYKDAKDDKDGDEATQKSYLNSFEEYVNDFEQELFSENKNWEEIKKYIDVKSFIKYFFIQEFAENQDSVRTSMFMYRYGTDPSDKIYLGPVWDFDIALGNYAVKSLGADPEIDYVQNIAEYRPTCLDWYGELFKIPEFVEEVNNIYNSEIKVAFDTAVNKIDSYENHLQVSAKMNFIKWSTQGADSLLYNPIGHKNKETYVEEVEYLRDWVRRRVDYLQDRYNKNEI